MTVNDDQTSARVCIASARSISLESRRPSRVSYQITNRFTATVTSDNSGYNLPAGTRLAIGSAVIEVSAQLHTGCAKFVERFGLDAMNFVNSSLGKSMHLRGINTRVVQPGTIRVGDRATKLSGN